tara:strand:- start:1741 stop:4128 length:2388 start_codon:yes stop_codon:yes gene_type:complete
MKYYLNLLLRLLIFITFSYGNKNYLVDFNPDSLRFKTAIAVRCSIPPVLDGKMEKNIWGLVQPVNEFFQIEPLELDAPNELTTARILYDDDALYIFIEAFDSKPEKIKKVLVRRDSWMDGFSEKSDWVGFAIDSKNDDYNGYFIAVNASGAIMDVALSGEWNFDRTWNPIWDVATSVNDKGWSAEFKLPFSNFQFENKEDIVWGIEFERFIHRLQEKVHWPGRPKSVRGLILPLGILKGINNIPNSHQLELVPYGLGGYSESLQTEIGLDLRYGLSSNSIMNITINPDFGQVEVDPSVLNLTAFETFYEEKRPFFSEGSEFFNHRISLFNSRRIGKKPSYDIPESGEIINVSDYTTILGATKIMGSTALGINYGVISALTSEESATHIDSINSKEIIIEPRTNYSIGRIEIPLVNNVSRFGVMVTNVARKNNPGASVIGADWRFGFFNNRLFANGQAIHSNTNNIRGNAFRFNIGYLDPTWWSTRLWYGTYDNKFDINDLGYLRRNGLSYLGTRLELRKQEPWGYFINNNLELKFSQEWNNDNIVIEKEIEVEQENLLKNYWNIGIFSKLFLPAYNDEDIFRNEKAWIYKTELRGYIGPSFSTDRRKKFIIYSNFGMGYGRNRGVGYNFNMRLEIKPIEPLNIEIRAIQDFTPEYMQWVDILELSDDTIRVYAKSRLVTQDITIRVNWTFSPRLTFQCFIQPFFVDMEYENYSRLIEQNTMNIEPYNYLDYYEKPDFILQNTVGTFVLRWEYNSGSTLYVVYNLNDNKYYSPVDNYWESESVHALYLKLNYWLKY